MSSFLGELFIGLLGNKITSLAPGVASWLLASLPDGDERVGDEIVTLYLQEAGASRMSVSMINESTMGR